MADTADHTGPGGRVFALMVGINAYLAPTPALHGCVNDVEATEQVLRSRIGDRLIVRKLFDADATRDGVIEAFREHLGQAGPDDTALFFYAGHGTEEVARREHTPLESTNRIQTLLVHDAGRRINGKLKRALADKELALLLAEVAQTAGHVAVILDCCSSGGGTRDPLVRTRGWTPDESMGVTGDRDLGALARPREDADFLPGALDLPQGGQPTHVALAACASSQKAKEIAGDTSRGVFSVAIGEALAALGEHATYRSLLAAVRSQISRTVDDQTPELFPVQQGGPADQPFLGGTFEAVLSRFTVSLTPDGWSVNGGTLHGLTAPTEEGAVTLACYGADGAVVGEVRVVTVSTTTSSVEPIDWTPDERVAYDALITSSPRPRVVATVDDDVDPEIAGAIRDRLARIGADGGPSPFVQITDDATVADGQSFVRITSPERGLVRIAAADGSPRIDDLACTGPADAVAVTAIVQRLEHIARWEVVRTLGGHRSPLADAVALDVFEGRRGEAARPDDREPLPAGSVYDLSYTRSADGGWEPPAVYLSLRNASDQDVWVALLALNDRYGISTVTAPCRLAAGHPGLAAIDSTEPIEIKLPAGREVLPGAEARDVLKVIVSDVEFDASSFDLAPIDQEQPEEDESASRSWGAVAAIDATPTRGLAAPKAEPQWAATTTELHTIVGENA